MSQDDYAMPNMLQPVMPTSRRPPSETAAIPDMPYAEPTVSALA